MFHGHAVCWVLGETLEAARLGAAAVEVGLRAAAVAGHDRRGDRGGELPGRPAAPAARRRRGRPGPPARTSSRASSSSPDRSTSTWRPTPRWPASTRPGRCSSSRSTQHPTETQEIIAHVLGRTSYEVTVQCLRMGGGFGGKEMQPHGFAAIAALGAPLTGRPVRLRLTRTQDMTMTGKRHGFHAPLAGRLRRRRAAPGAQRDADLGRRLEPRPVRAGAGPGAVPHRQRLLDPEHRGARPDREDQQDVADGVPRASAARRACW